MVAAVPTYQRNDRLRALLPQLAQQLADVKELASGRRILVSDNDPSGGAQGVVTEAAETLDVHIDYLHVATPGIAANRNACLGAAAGHELLAFIDDDQVPRPPWLRSLIVAMNRTGSDVIAGPTRPIYAAPVAGWIEAGPFHDASHLPRDARMGLSAVTNCLLDVGAIRATGVAFPEIGTRGGEDSWFTAELARRGAVITWEPDAIVDEPVPASRTTPRWVMTRSLGNGIIAGRIGIRHTSNRARSAARWRYTAGGVARVLGGTARAGVGIVRNDPAALGGGLHTFARGVGMGLGAWDVVFDEYSRTNVGRWQIERNADR